MKLIIAGGREFNNYNLVKQTFQDIYGQLELSNITIISGCARGADALGIQLANELGCNKLLFPANWTKYGKKAGYMRNEEMAKMFAEYPEERTKFMIRAEILNKNGNWINYSKQKTR